MPKDYLLYFDDLQVLGKKEMEELIIWRNKIRTKLNLSRKENNMEKEEKKEEDKKEKDVNKEKERAKYDDRVTPAIILIPGVFGKTGEGIARVKGSVEQAVGSDILFGNE